MEAAVYWIWFHRVFSSSARGRKLLEKYKNPVKLYEALKNREISPPKSPFSLVDAVEIKEICDSEGYRIITPDSPFYPEDFRTLKDMPSVLFADGEISVLSEKLKVAVVGSRSSSPEGRDIAFRAAKIMAENSAAIVSGGAAGIDMAAHEGTAEGKGAAILAAGCGLGNPYLKRLGSLYDKVKENGVIITEMFPFENASRFTFPRRNRIISALSSGVLVVEAPEKSGAMITADYARQQKKKIFAVSPDILYSEGCQRLIENGACPVSKAGDIIYPLALLSGRDIPRNEALDRLLEGIASDGEKRGRPAGEKPPEPKILKPRIKPEIPEDMPENVRIILDSLGDGILYADEICEKTKLSPSDVMEAFTDLEIMGLAEILPGSRVRKIY